MKKNIKLLLCTLMIIGAIICGYISIKPNNNFISTIIGLSNKDKYDGIYSNSSDPSDATISFAQVQLDSGRHYMKKFSPDDFYYSVKVYNTNTTVSLVLIKSNSNTTFKIYRTVGTGSATLLSDNDSLEWNPTTTPVSKIEVQATSQDKSKTLNYVFRFDYRDANSTADIQYMSLQCYTTYGEYESTPARIEVSPTFSPDTLAYTAKVPDNCKSQRITSTIQYGNGLNGPNYIYLDEDNKTTEWNNTVTSKDGTNSQTYTIFFTKESISTTLYGLSISDGKLTSAGYPQSYYTATVPSTVSSVNISYKRTVSGEVQTEKFDLNDGENVWEKTVYSEFGNSELYKITITKKSQANDTYLKNLSIDGYQISPTFDRDTFNYTVTIPYRNKKIKINAEAYSSTSQVSGKGEITLEEDRPVQNIVVTSSDGSTRTYKITITRNKSNDNTLSSLGVAGYSLSPAFSSTTTNYTVNVPTGTTKVTVTGAATDSEATVEGLGEIELDKNTNSNRLTVKVTSESGSRQSYLITVNVGCDDATLSYYRLQNGRAYEEKFNKDYSSYRIRIYNWDDEVNFYVTPSFRGATVKLEKQVGTTTKPAETTTSIDWNPGTENVTKVTAYVTSQDGTQQETYYFYFSYADENSTADIYWVWISCFPTYGYGSSSSSGVEITLEPNFYPDTLTYNAKVPQNCKSQKLNTTFQYGNGGFGPGTIQLDEDNTTTTWTHTVTSTNGSASKTYKVNFEKVSTDSTLDSLTVSEGTLTPRFSSSTTNYTVEVPSDVTSIEIYGETSVGHHPIMATVPLHIGENVWERNVYSEFGNYTTYKVTINRSNETNANLSALSVAGQTLSPTFDANTTDYTVNVASDVKQVTVNYTIDTVGTPENEAVLLTGTKTTWSKTITAPDGTTKKTYTITINRAKSSNANLSSLTLSNATLNESFNKDVLTYTANVGENVTGTKVSFTREFDNSSSSEDVSLSYGLNTWSVTITAEDGTTKKTYTIKITRALSSNANLSGLSLSNATLNETFNKDVLTYTANVGENVTSTKVTYVKEFDNSSLSENVDLSPGLNTWSVTITAPNGTTKKTYKIKITRALSSNASLASLSVTGHTLSPAFNTNTTDYTVNVANDVNQVTINYKIDASGDEDHESKVIDGFQAVWSLTVTAPNGTTKKTYTITINRAKSSNANLKSLTLSNATLNETFNKDVLTYTANVGENVTGTKVSFTREFDNSSSSEDVSLNYGLNTWSTTVTAEDGVTKKTYTIKITRALSSNANLKSITLSAGTLSPAFNANTTDYTASVGNEISKVTVTSVKEFDNSSTSKEYNLSVGSNLITISVTAPNGTTKKDYKITITRAANNDATLKSLGITGYTLNETFSPLTTEYSVNIPYLTTSVTINAEANSTVASVSGKGAKTLTEESTRFKITVTAQDKTEKDYYLTVNRVKDTDATLSALSVTGYTLSPTFNKDTLSYTVIVPYTTESVVVDATSTSNLATLQGKGSVTLTNVDTNHNVVVTSQSGIKKTYTIKISRVKSTDATLKSLSISGYQISPSFNKDVTSYTATVPYRISNVSINAETTYQYASVTGKGLVTLTGDTYTITVRVTAEDGTTTKDYTINVTRTKATDATLSSLSVTGYSLSPSFNSSTEIYSVNVPHGTANVSISATTKDEKARVTGTGNIKVVGDLTVANLVVTAEDGTTTKTYTVNINQAKSDNARTTNLKTPVGILISPTFDPSVQNYVISTDKREFDITYKKEATGEEVTKKVTVPADKDSITVEIENVAPNGTNKLTYTFVVNVVNKVPFDEVGAITINSDMDSNIFNEIFGDKADGITLNNFEVKDPEILEIIDNKIVPKSKGTTQIIYDKYSIEVTVSNVNHDSSKVDYTIVDKILISDLLGIAKNQILNNNLSNEGLVTKPILIENTSTTSVGDISVTIENDNMLAVDGNYLVVLSEGTSTVVLGQEGNYYSINLKAEFTKTATDTEEGKTNKTNQVVDNPKTGIFDHYGLAILSIILLAGAIILATGKYSTFRRL